MPHEFDGKKYERTSAGLQQEWGAKLIAELKLGGDGNCAPFIRVIREAMALPEFESAFADFEWPWYMPSAESFRRINPAARK